MDRRIFVKSLLGVAGAAAAASAFAPRAEALPLLDELKAMDAAGANPLKSEAAAEADLPAPGAMEAQYYYGPRRRYWGRPYYRPYRRVYRPFRRCRTFVNRWGRLVRRCWVG